MRYGGLILPAESLLLLGFRAPSKGRDFYSKSNCITLCYKCSILWCKCLRLNWAHEMWRDLLSYTYLFFFSWWTITLIYKRRFQEQKTEQFRLSLACYPCCLFVHNYLRSFGLLCCSLFLKFFSCMWVSHFLEPQAKLLSWMCLNLQLLIVGELMASGT